MTRITGIITELKNIDQCWLRLKASVAWIGVGTDIKIFPVIYGTVDIDLPATVRDRVWLVDYAYTRATAGFTALESWTVPIEDCTVSQIRNFSLTYVEQLEQKNRELELRLQQKDATYAIQAHIHEQEVIKQIQLVRLKQAVDSFGSLAANNIEKLS